MASPMRDEAVGQSHKKIRGDEKQVECGDDTKTIHDNPSVALSMLHFKRVLNENSSSKMIVVEAEHGEQSAVVILEKMPFDEDTARQLIAKDDKPLVLSLGFRNDIYANYFCSPPAELNTIKATIIHPASDKHIQKYTAHNIYIASETPDNYKNITLPHIEAQQFSLKWLENILDHKSEVSRIIFEDPDPNVGFVLLPDMKWDGKQLNSLYLVAICRKKGIRSLRDLTSHHLELLENIKSKGTSAIQATYGASPSTLRIYIHYQPSYYHLHIHFTAVAFDAPGCQAERAHLLDTVINNISLCADYYQKSTLSFPLKQSDPLFAAFQQANLFSL